MRTPDRNIVPVDMVIQVEHVAFSTYTETHFCPSNKRTISPAYLEKFVVSNPALKQLEFTHNRSCTCDLGLIPALNHCLSTLYQQGRGLEELVLNFGELNVKYQYVKKLFIQVRDLSHRHGTILVLSYFSEYTFIQNLAKEKDFQMKKIKKIVCTMENEQYDPSPYLELIAETVEMHFRRPSYHRYY